MTAQIEMLPTDDLWRLTMEHSPVGMALVSPTGDFLTANVALCDMLGYDADTMATLSFQRGIPGGQLGEGAAIAVAMVPFLLAALMFSFFGLQRRKWQQGGQD